MAGQDKTAVAYSIAITAIFIGIAVSMSTVQDAGSTFVSPMIEKESMDKAKPEKTVEIEKEVMMKEKPVMNEKVMIEKSAGPTTHNVEIPVGTSIPGCEKDDTCYSPADITINAGDTIVWDNVDSAVHTVTAGSPADAQMSMFHSDLIMPGDTWDNTFDDAGSDVYFCLVHPWMTGSVTVN